MALPATRSVGLMTEFSEPYELAAFVVAGEAVAAAVLMASHIDNSLTASALEQQA